MGIPPVVGWPTEWDQSGNGQSANLAGDADGRTPSCTWRQNALNATIRPITRLDGWGYPRLSGALAARLE
jgi:hypothetical protein